MKRFISVLALLALILAACMIFAACNDAEDTYFGPEGYYKAEGYTHNAYEFDGEGGVICYKPVMNEYTLKYTYEKTWVGSVSFGDKDNVAIFTYTEDGAEKAEEIGFKYFSDTNEGADYVVIRGIRMDKVSAEEIDNVVNDITPYVGPNGNWWIGKKDTNVRVEYAPCTCEACTETDETQSTETTDGYWYTD